jgi:hypothetical protein
VTVVRVTGKLLDERGSAERRRVQVVTRGLLRGPQVDVCQQGQSALTPHVRAELFPALKVIEQARCPFANLPSSKTGHWGEGITAEDMAVLRWLKPRIVAEVAFVEWTRSGLLRHPEFVAVRTDKRARAVKRQT